MKCKNNDAYNKFHRITSQDAMLITYWNWSVLNINNIRSDILATIKHAINNINNSQTFYDIDQNMSTVINTLKTRIKQGIRDFLTRIIPITQNFLSTAEARKQFHLNGPQSTYNMLCKILTDDPIVPPIAKDILTLFSPQFDVDKLINDLFEYKCNSVTLKKKKFNAREKLVDSFMSMDTALNNIDCFIWSALVTVGNGLNTLKLLKSHRVIMTDKHPRAKSLKNAIGIIKSFSNILKNENFISNPDISDNVDKNNEDDDEDPDVVAQKNEVYLNAIPHLDHNVSIPIKIRNKPQSSLGVIVVHPDKQIEYKEVTNSLELNKFVRNRSRKYELQSLTNPKFLKVNSKQLIDTLVKDVKKKADKNGMSKIEMANEIIKHLKSN